MAEEFDPYYEWLGIPKKDQPPHHYRLLGIELFEENLNVIERSADRQMGHVRSFQTGRHAKDSQRLLNELSAAKVCLLNPQRKTDYDQQLQQQLASRSLPDSGLPPGASIPELPPGVPAATASPAPFVPRTSAIDVGLAIKNEHATSSVRRRPSSSGNRWVWAGAAVVVLVGCLLGLYFLMFGGRGAKGPNSSPGGTPDVVKKESTEATPSSAVSNDSTAKPPQTQTSDAKPAPSKSAPENNARIPVFNESTAKIVDPASLPDSSKVSTAISDMISSAAGMVDSRFAFCQTLPWGRFEEVNRALRTQGFRVSRCRPYLAMGEWRVAAIWLRDGLPSRTVGLTDAATLQKADQRLSEQGFVPVDVVGVSDGRRERFAAVWVHPNSPVGTAALTLGVSDAEYKKPSEQLRQQGFRSAVHVVHFDAAGKRKYSDLWIKSTNERDWSIWAGEQAEASKQLAQDAVHTDAGVAFDPASGWIFTGSEWQGEKDVVKSFVGLAPEDLRNVAVEQGSAGYLPASLSVACTAGGQRISVSLWRPADQMRTPLELARLEPSPTPTPTTSAPTPMPAAAELALRFAGQGSIELRDSVGLANISSDFTIESWLRFNEQSYGAANILFGTGAYRGLHPEVTNMAMKGWLAGIKPARAGSAAKSQFIFQWAEAGGQTQSHTGDILAFDDQWHHLALCNRGSTAGWELVVYVDGQESLRLSHSSTKDAASPVGVYFGRPQYVAASRRSLHGLVRAFRLSTGLRYSGSFQPEAQFKGDAQTVALLDFSAATGAEIADRSGNNRNGGIVGAEWVDLDGKLVPNANPLASSPTPASVVEKLKVPANHESQVAKVREVFKDEIAGAKDPLAWTTLAKKLLSQAAEEQDPALQYALFGEARRMAVEGIDWNLAARSIEELASRFQVDAWTLRAEVLNAFTKKAKIVSDRKLLAETALAQAVSALGEGMLETVESLLSSASNLAPRGERDLIKQVSDLRKRLSEEKKAQQLVRDARAKLAELPQDNLANETLGKYLCFTKDDWEVGVRHLALGPDGKLTLLARSDDARPTDVSERLALADSWSEFAKATSDAASKSGATNRALHWYQLALPDLTGVKKVQTEKQIEDLSKSVPSSRGKVKFTWLDGEPGVALELKGHSSEVTCLAIARSGRMLVSGSLDDTVRIWELSAGKQTGQISPGIGDVNGLLLSPDDRTVAIPVAVSGEYSVGVWSLQNGQPVGSIKADGMARQLAGSQDWRRVAYSKSQAGPGNLLIYNLTSLTPVGQLNCPGAPVHIAVSRTGRFLAAADGNNVVYVWDMQTAKGMITLTGHAEAVTGLAFSPNERQLVSCGNRNIIVWELAKGIEERRITPPDGVPATTVTFSPDGSRLLVSGTTTEISVYNAQEGTMIAQIRAPNTGGASSPTRAMVSFADGRAAAMVGYDSVIRIWRLPP